MKTISWAVLAWLSAPAIAFACATEAADPVNIFVETVNVERSIAVCQQKSAIIQKRKVGRQKPLSIPAGFRARIFTRRVDARFHWCLAKPDGITLQR